MSNFLKKYRVLLVIFFGILFFINTAEAKNAICKIDQVENGSPLYGFVFLTVVEPGQDTNVFKKFDEGNSFGLYCIYDTDKNKKDFKLEDFFDSSNMALNPNSFFHGILTNKNNWIDGKYATEELENEDSWEWDIDIYADRGTAGTSALFSTDRTKRVWLEPANIYKPDKEYIFYYGPGWSEEGGDDLVEFSESSEKASLKNLTWGYFGTKYTIKDSTKFPGPYECVCEMDSGESCLGSGVELECSINAIALKIIPSKMNIQSLPQSFNYNLFLKSKTTNVSSNKFKLNIKIESSICADFVLEEDCNKSAELKLCEWDYDASKREKGCIVYNTSTPLTPSTPIPSTPAANVDFSRYGVPPGYDGPLPECAFSGTCRDVNKLLELAINIGEWLFKIIGSLGFVFFIYGGFSMVISFGNAEKFKKGQQVLVAAIIGMIIAFGAYAIVKFLLESLGVQESWTNLIFK